MIQPAPVPSWGRAVERAERIRGSQNQNLLAEQRLKDYPKEEQWRAEQRGRQRTTWNREDEVYKREVERLKFKDEADALDYMIKSSPMINWQNYPDSRQHLLDMGLNPAALPEPEVIYNRAMEAGADPNQFFEAWKNKALMTGQQRLELIKKQADISARGYKPGTKEEALAFEKAMAEIKKEFTKPTYEQKTLYGPQGQTRNVPVQKGTEYTPPKGWSLAKPEKLQKEPTPQQALMRISGIRKTMATLDKTNEITAMIIAANPELAGMVGQKIDDDLKQQLMDAWNDELDYLYRFVPKSTKKPKRELNVETARKILQEAGGDKGKAREIAKSRGYTF